MEKKMQQMKELVELLNRAGKAYYQEDREIMSNLEYDRLYDRLENLEKETGTVLANSPTVNVGYEVLEQLPKEEHALGAALVDGGVVVLPRLPREGGPAAVAEQGAVAVQGAAHRALLVLDFRPGVWRLGRGRRLPLLAFFMQVVENTRAFFLITSPVVGCAALRADDNVIPRAEGHPAHRALDSSVIQHKWSFP